MRVSLIIAIAFTLVAGTTLVSACGGGETDAERTQTAAARSPAAGGGAATTVAITARDFEFALDVSSAPAGQVTFDVNNAGPSEHELIVLKTDLAPRSLPVEGNIVNEDAAGIEVVDEIEDIGAGESKSLTVDLEPGRYVLICNIPLHYQNGMTTAFTVE